MDAFGGVGLPATRSAPSATLQAPQSVDNVIQRFTEADHAVTFA
jgi:hypothetical protein